MENYIVDINRIIDSNTTPSVVKLMFMQLQKTPYVTVSDFLKDVSDQDLNFLVQETNNMSSDDEKQQFESQHTISLVALAFCCGEGEAAVSLDSMVESMKLAVLYITLESLSRKNLIKPLKQNWCMDIKSSKPVAEKY